MMQTQDYSQHPASKTPRVGVGILIARPGEVFLIHRHGAHGQGSWSTPGGHLDIGETPEACAIREGNEETGLDIRRVRFCGLTNDYFKGEGLHYITLWFEAVEYIGEARLAAPDEMSEIGWFAWDALPQPLFLPLQNLLDGNSYPVPPLFRLPPPTTR